MGPQRTSLMRLHLCSHQNSWGIPLFLVSLTVGIVIGCSPVELDSPNEERYDNARAHYKAKEYEKAAAGFREIIRDHPYSVELDDSRYWLGRALLRIADTSADTSRKIDRTVAALKAFTAIDERSTYLVDALYYANWSRMEIEELAPSRYTTNEIVEEYDRIAAEYPENERAVYSLLAAADLLGERDRDTAAIERFGRVIQEYRDADPELIADAFNGTADSHRHLGNCVSALAYYDSAMAVAADTSAMRTALYWSGKCSLELGDTANACAGLNGLIAYSHCSDTTGTYLPNALQLRTQIGCDQSAACSAD